MEDQLKLIDKYFQLYDDKNYQEKIYEFSYTSIICHFVEYEIYSYDNGNLTNQNIINKKIKNYIIKIKDLKSKIKLIPLLLFFGEEYWKHLIEINYFDDIKSFLLDDFKSLSFKIDFKKINEFSNIYESQKDLINGIEKKEFKTITNFNMNPNMGNYQYAHFIYFVANRFFFDEYCQALDKKNDFTFLFLISNLEYGQERGFDKRLKIFEHIINNKTLLQIKLLEDILLYGDNEAFICKATIDFSMNLELWQNFISFYFEYPSRYPKLFKPLSKAINKLDKKNIDLLLDGIKISESISDDNQKALNNFFLNIQKDEIQEYCLKILFERWLKFINTSSGYFGSIILTDITYLAIVYIKDFWDQKVIIQEIERVLYDLEEINNKWFGDELEYSNYFYKLMTKLFTYGFAIKKYKLYDLKEKISLVCSVNPILKKEKSYQKKTSLRLFDEYILGRVINCTTDNVPDSQRGRFVVFY